jgi:RsiW-degrading membrane proteinase PrsW (M82 family)
MSKTLENTQLSFAYSIFLAKNDVSLIQNFVWIISAAILWTIWNNLNGRTFAYGKGLKDEKVQDSKQKDVKFWNYPISSKITWRVRITDFDNSCIF